MINAKKQKIMREVTAYLAEQLADATPEKGMQMAKMYFGFSGGTSYKDNMFCANGSKAEPLLAKAEMDRAAFDALANIAGYAIQNGEALQAPIKNFNLKLIRQEIERPTRRQKWENLARDLPVCNAIRMLVDAGFTATRNEVTETKSACDVIADIVPDIKYDLATKIWLRYKEHIYLVAKHGPYYFSLYDIPLALKDHY